MVAGCNDLEAGIVRAAFVGCKLRAGKPYNRIDFDDHSGKALAQACANYVWRMLCFDFVEHTPHSCFPVCADFDVSHYFYKKFGCSVFDSKPGYAENVKKTIAGLDVLIKRIETGIPVTLMPGVMRWAGLV
jgi:hypothetical protein